MLSAIMGRFTVVFRLLWTIMDSFTVVYRLLWTDPLLWAVMVRNLLLAVINRQLLWLLCTDPLFWAVMDRFTGMGCFGFFSLLIGIGKFC